LFASVAGALALCCAAVPAQADEVLPDGSVTWSFRPSDEQGMDKRSWVELTLDPGESAQEYAELRNLSAHEVTFAIKAADGYFTDKGRFNMLPASEESTEAGLWIQVEDSVTLGPDERVVVPFTVTVPSNATPGDHPAGLAATVRSPGADGQGGTVAVDSRVGFRVMTRVTGDYVSTLDLTVDADYSERWNPFQPGTVTVNYVFTNTGNTRLAVTPSATVAGPFGLLAKHWEAEAAGELAPGEERAGSFRVQGMWPLGRWVATVEVSGEPVIDTGGPSAAATAQDAVAAVPWPQLIVVVVAVALVIWWRKDRSQRRRALDRRIEDAVERGRRQARDELTVGGNPSEDDERSAQQETGPREQADARGPGTRAERRKNQKGKKT
jgi:hypothetical protein